MLKKHSLLVYLDCILLYCERVTYLFLRLFLIVHDTVSYEFSRPDIARNFDIWYCFGSLLEAAIVIPKVIITWISSKRILSLSINYSNFELETFIIVMSNRKCKYSLSVHNESNPC